MRTFIRLPAVKAMTGVTTSTIYYWMADGRFPRPRKLSPRVAVWDLDEVKQWMNQADARSAKTA